MTLIVTGDHQTGYHVYDAKGALLAGPYPSIEQAIAAMDDCAAPHLCPECGRVAS